MNLKERITHPATMEEPKNTSSEALQNLSNSSQSTSSQPLGTQWPSLTMPELLKKLDQSEQDIWKKGEELQALKEQNSMLSSQNSKLMQMLEEQAQSAQSEKLKLQSTVARLKEELANEKQQKQQVEMLNQRLVSENDDLRNRNGISTRNQEAGILNCNKELEARIKRLEAENNCLKIKVNSSTVKAVETANYARDRAITEAERAREKALKDITEARHKMQDAIIQLAIEQQKVVKMQNVHTHRQCLSYGLLATFLLVSSFYHPQIWNDLRSLLETSADWLAKNWIGALLHPEGMSGLLRWISLCGLPVLMCIPGIGSAVLLISLWRNKSIRSVVAMVTVLGVIVFFGEYYLWNTALLLIESFLVIRLVQCLFKNHIKKAPNQKKRD